ncbi:uncharacterized protein LOC116853559 isoform X3 [Odontomachus brunneus]|uniref:uncharacterized protein LOC116853559 isoform X3 n=1 Tax=Odontomachus brunneus TaxID=486640 RepID=UPI0013F2A44F|nr:uncharacterized protein LOC116853559 isoform X3 [Odontomachus brunneus]
MAVQAQYDTAQCAVSQRSCNHQSAVTMTAARDFMTAPRCPVPSDGEATRASPGQRKTGGASGDDEDLCNEREMKTLRAQTLQLIFSAIQHLKNINYV